MNTDDPGNPEGRAQTRRSRPSCWEASNGLLAGPLFPPGLTAARRFAGCIEDAPFCILARNTAADPRFIDANGAAQHRFEYPWAEFSGSPRL